MRALRMTRKLHDFRVLELEHLLEFLAQTHEDILAFLGAASLAPGDVSLATSRHALSYRFGPQPHAVEAFADIDHHAHDFAVVVAVLEGFADGG